MSVVVKIRQNRFFKKNITIQDLIGNKLGYGICDEYYRLVPNQTGDVTLIYDPQFLARGIEVSFEENDILLRLNLPTSYREMSLFYNLVKQICQTLKIEQFIREDEISHIQDIDYFIECDQEGSIAALKEIKEEIENGQCEHFLIFGINNPISIGKKEITEIGWDLDRLEQFLNEKQQLDVYYARPHVYKKEDFLFGVYVVGENIPSIVPLEPYIILDQIKGIEKWYVILGDGSDNIVEYHDFINHIQTSEYYDAQNIIVTMSKDDINDMISKYKTKI